LEDLPAVWQRYAETKDAALRNRLIASYAPLVKLVAGRLAVNIGHRVEFDDLVSYGIFGLIDAIDRFDPVKNIKFETYASIRIRGSIIDNIRKLDWVPRSLRTKSKQLEQVFSELSGTLGREPTEDEISDKLNISIEETRELLSKASVVSLISLDDYLEQNNSDSTSALTDESDNPEKNIEAAEVKRMLADAIDALPEREKKVVTLYYFEELTLKEISAVLGVSESRISQIHTKAVMLLQARLGRYKSLMFA
jgi:RNA polymerase sigma factor for flagellar operon FliA